MLDLTRQHGIVFPEDSPVHTSSQFEVWVKEQLITGRQWGCARDLRNGMEGVQIDSTMMSIHGQELREWIVEIIVNKRGNNVFIPIWNDEKMACPSGIEVVLPAQTGMSTGLWISGGRRLVLFVSLHSCNFLVLVRDLAIQDHGQLFVVCTIKNGQQDLMDGGYIGEREVRR